MQSTLIDIPVLDIPIDRDTAVFSAAAEPERLALLLKTARHTYTPLGMRLADARSRTWAAALTTPYRAEIARVAQTLNQPGAYLLNYSYEWGCTTGARNDTDLGGTTLLRTLDWPFDGLGRSLIAVRRQTAVGSYLSATWPGFAGLLTGMAPGRFAAAINQPPLPLPRWGKAIGWLAARGRVHRSHALPPSHLLRLAFETCVNFSEAVVLIQRIRVTLANR